MRTAFTRVRRAGVQVPLPGRGKGLQPKLPAAFWMARRSSQSDPPRPVGPRAAAQAGSTALTWARLLMA